MLAIDGGSSASGDSDAGMGVVLSYNSSIELSASAFQALVYRAAMRRAFEAGVAPDVEVQVRCVKAARSGGCVGDAGVVTR
jgi:hypothetical protein